MAPLDRPAQCPLSRFGGARPGDQQPETVVEPGGDLLDRERLDPGRGQLDGQRNSVQAPAHLGDR